MRPPTTSAFAFRYLRPGSIASLGGTASAVTVSVLLVPARDWLGNTNVALLLLLVVVGAAAYGGRSAGAITSIAASLTFNATHTVPYGTLVIEDRKDMITTFLVAGVGIAVGELTHRRVAAANRARRREYAVDRVHRVAELVRLGRPLDEVIVAVRQELSAELGLAALHFEPEPPDPSTPLLQHTGNLDAAADQLPSTGAAVIVHRAGQPVGHLLLVPGGTHTPNHAGQIVAVIMADLVGAAIGAPPRSSPRS